MTYKPMKFFLAPGLAMGAIGVLIGLRFLYFYFTGQGQGHLQSLVLTAILILVGAQMVLFGLVAELIGNNRKLLEDVQWRTRRMELEVRTGHPEEAE